MAEDIKDDAIKDTTPFHHTVSMGPYCNHDFNNTIDNHSPSIEGIMTDAAQSARSSGKPQTSRTLMNMPSEIRNHIWETVARESTLQMPVDGERSAIHPMLLVSKQVRDEFKGMLLHEASITAVVRSYNFTPLVDFLTALPESIKQALKRRPRPITVHLCHMIGEGTDMQCRDLLEQVLEQFSDNSPRSSQANILIDIPIQYSAFMTVSQYGSVYAAHSDIFWRTANSSKDAVNMLVTAAWRSKNSPYRMLLRQMMEAELDLCYQALREHQSYSTRLSHQFKRLVSGTSVDVLHEEVQRELLTIAPARTKTFTSPPIHDRRKIRVELYELKRRQLQLDMRIAAFNQAATDLRQRRECYRWWTLWPQISFIVARNFVVSELGDIRSRAGVPYTYI